MTAEALVSWTVRRDATGVWQPDWAESEPDPIPVPTIGWLTWHIDCPPQAGGTPRWSVTIDHVRGQTPRDRADVVWPGNGTAAVSRLRQLSTQWRELLIGLGADDLDRPCQFPPGLAAEHTVAHTSLWVNVELTKNIAEIGQLRLLGLLQR